jgi:hypothetical protein
MAILVLAPALMKASGGTMAVAVRVVKIKHGRTMFAPASTVATLSEDNKESCTLYV